MSWPENSKLNLTTDSFVFVMCLLQVSEPDFSVENSCTIGICITKYIVRNMVSQVELGFTF